MEMVQLVVQPLSGKAFNRFLPHEASVKALLHLLGLDATGACLHGLKFRGLYLRAALPKDARHGEVLRVVIAAPLRGGGCCSSRPTVASQDVALEFSRAVPGEDASPLAPAPDQVAVATAATGTRT